MYFVLGLSIVLAVMLVLNSIASLIASLIWRLFEKRISGWSAANCSQTLFLLRIVPAVLGLICVLFLFAPAYLRHEPRNDHEDVSLKLALVAAFSALGIALAVLRGIAAWRATSRLTADWMRIAEPIQISKLNVPTYQFEHKFPLIAVVGALRPRLFIAKQIFQTLTEDEVSAALEHEAGHILAYDNLKRGVMRACRDALLIIPCGRKLDSAWFEASEAAADEYAARRGRKIGLDLASAMVKIARQIPLGAKPTMVAGAFLVGGDSQGLRTRVRRLLQIVNDPQQHTHRPSLLSQVPKWISICLILLLIGITATQPHVLMLVHAVIEHAVYILD
ncbi:MAG: M56 family metallopeptidase [Pyrinomonadaceae bacterium]